MATALELAEERAKAKLRRARVPDDNSEPVDDLPNDGELPDDGETTEGDGQPSEVEVLRARLEQANQTLSALQGRLTPAQQALEAERAEARTLRLRLEQQERARQEEIAKLQQELEARNSQLNIEDILDEDERADIDPTVLKAFTKIADHVAQRRIPKIDARAEALRAIQERDEQRVKDYREQILLDPTRGLHNLDVLSRDHKFVEWAQTEDVDLDSTLNSLLRAKTEKDVDRYAKIASRKISQFHAQSKAGSSPNRPADAQPRLSAGLRRGGGQRITDAQRDAKLAEARSLARSTNASDRAKAKAILDSLT